MRGALPWLAGVLTVTALVLSRTLWGEFVYDDHELIARNPALHGWPQLWEAMSAPLWGPELGYWRPLTSAALCVGYTLGDGGTFVLHAMSLLAHLGATAVVFALVKRLSGDLRVATFAALVFGIHPVQVESVAWISSINDPLWGLFAMLALYAHSTWRDRGAARAPLMAPAWWLLAMLSKETAVVVPIAILLLDAVWFSPGLGRTAARAYAPLLVVGLIYAALRIAVFGDLAAGLDLVTADPGVSGARLIMLRPELVGGFCELLCVPVPSSLFRDVPVELAVTDHAFLVPVSFAVAFAVLAVVAARRRWRAVLFGIGVVFASLLPGIVRVESLGAYPLADRYLYFAVFGFATVGGWLLMGPPAGGRSLGAARVFVAVVLVVGYARISFDRIPFWSTQQSLVTESVRQHPDNPQLQYMLGRELLDQQRSGKPQVLDGASGAFRRAIELLDRPRYARPTIAARIAVDIRVGMAWCVLLQLETSSQPRYEVARLAFADVVADYPDDAEAYIGLGVASAMAGDFRGAERALLRAVDLDPGSGEAHHNLGRFYFVGGSPQRARGHLEEALRLRPDLDEARRMLEQIPR